jgi:radical SAM superfamily enzyme YgiQ (UPF0313 family)
MSVLLAHKSPVPDEIANQRFYEYLSLLKAEFPFRNRVALIHCPTFNFDSFNVQVAKNRAYYAYPPTGLQCLKTVLLDLGFEVDILDLNFLLLERVCTADPSDPLDIRSLLDEYFDAHDVSVVGVSAGVIVSNIFGVANHPFIQTLSYLMKKQDCMVLAGGVIANNEWKNLLKRDLAHFVFDGEAENKLTYFIKHLAGKKTGTLMQGIYFKHEGEIGGTSGEKDIVNFHGNLIPSYDQIKIESYNKVGCLSPFSRMVGPEKKYATTQLVRGCRAQCTFCGVTPFMGSVRQYPVDSVIREILHLVRERGVKHIEWLDDDLLADRQAAIDLFRKIIDLDLGITWAANNGLIASFLDQELLRYMVDSGGVGFRIGIESGNDDILKKIKKPASKQSLRQASKLLAQFPELFVVGCYIIGFENETVGQIFDTFKFSIEMNLSWAGFSECQVVRDASIDDEFDTDHQGGAYKKVADFVPSKETVDRTINAKDGGRDSIFFLPKNSIPSPENLHEMWYTFNLLTNYVFNKNLLPSGSPEQFTRWVTILQLSYPENAVMRLFHFLSLRLSCRDEEAVVHFSRAQEILEKSDYWTHRFEQFFLDKIMENPPKNKLEAHQTIKQLRDRFWSVVENL